MAFADLEERVPANHPLRIINASADEATTRLSPEFDWMYAEMGRPSVPAERLLKASMLTALYSVRSERALLRGVALQSTVPLTDPEVRLFRRGKGREGKRVFMAHALMENCNGLLVDFLVSDATGTAERDAVPVLLDEARERGFHPRTLGGDKGYDTRGCVGAMRARGVAPHVAQHTSGRSSAIDGRTTRHRGYALSQRLRKRVEEIFGWMKTVGGFRRTRYRGLDRTGLAGYLVGTAYNLVRMARLMTAETPAPQAAQAA